MADELTEVFAPILKTAPQPDGSLLVYGKATGSDLDLDQQRCDPAWLRRAMPSWFAVGNIREQHDPQRAVGKATEYDERDDGHYITAKIVDPVAKAKTEAGIFTGFSIGIKSPRIAKSASAPNGVIQDGRIVEVSIVDTPCLPTATLTLAKALKPGPMTVAPGTVDHERHLVKVEELHEDVADTDDLEKRDFSAGERREAASHHQAMDDGSFPIKNASDLANAIRLAGNAKDPAKAKAHIKRRAAALGLSDKIPDTWKADTASLIKTLQDLIHTIQEGAVPMAHIETTDQPVAEKAAAPDAAQTPEPEVVEKATEGEEKTDLTELVKAAVAEAVAPIQAQLAKAMEQPAPGGPVLTRTTEDTAKAAAREGHLNKAAEYERLARELADPNARAGYLELAAEERAAAS